jgi:caspase 7
MQRDLDSDAFEARLEEFAADEAHARADSAVVCVLSHGQEKGVYATDGIIISFTSILDALDGQRCPSLINKPKLFFFQACRGVRVQRGFDIPDASHAGEASSGSQSGSATPTPDDSSSSSSSHSKNDDFYQVDSSGDFAVPQCCDVADSLSKAVSLAKYSDMVVSFSTIPGHISIRHEEMGSWYVQAIVDVFSEFAADRDVHSLLTKVNRKVSKMSTGGQPRKQMPAPTNHLTRDFYFFPGYYGEDQNKAIDTLLDIGRKQPLQIA